MKTLTTTKFMNFVTGVAIALALSVPSLTYARDDGHGWHWGHGFKKVEHNDDHGDRRHWGFKRGHHWGHDRGHGNRKGHKNHRNPWYEFYKARFGKKDTDDTQEEPPQDPGVDVTLEVRDRALNPGTTFNATYNSTQTVQEVLADLLGSSTEGYVLQECYETTSMLLGTTTNDCAADETLAPLDSSLTLEAAGIVDDPVVYLVYIAP